MPVYNGRGRRIVKTRKALECDGCGRILPKGSLVLRWLVWLDGFQHKLSFCSDCQGVIHGCSERRSIKIAEDWRKFICREICESCDGFPFCEKVDYLRESEPGDLFFGDLET